MKVNHKRRWKIFVVAVAAMALVAGMVSFVPSAYAGGTIKIDDDKYIDVGMGIRSQFSSVQGSSANGGGMGNNFGINNARIYINGKIHKYVGFEFNTECFNCAGGSGGTSGTERGTNFGGNSTMGLLDAIGKFEFNQYANLWVGRMLVTGERGELNGPFYHATFEGFKTPLNSADYSDNFGVVGRGFMGAGLYGRDNGATFWGQVDPAVGHLQYSVGVYSGLRNTGGGGNAPGANQQNSMLYAGRLTYNFFNAEKNPGYYTSGTYYGTAGDILAIAIGANHQQNGAGAINAPADLTIFVADLLFEKPLANNGGVITVNAEVKQYFANYNQNVVNFAPGGGCFCMFDGLSWTGYAMYLLPNDVGIGKFQPYARFTSVQPNNSSKREETEAGVNYIIAGHNARISAFWQYGDLASKGSQGGPSIYSPDRLGDRAHAFKLALQLQY